MRSTSATLLARLRDPRDSEAWMDFQQRYGRRLTAWCQQRGLQEADAADVVQNVMLKVANCLRTSFVYDPARNGGFSGWLRLVWQSQWADFWHNRELARQLESIDYEKMAAQDPTPCIKEELDLDVFHEAVARARPLIKPRDWQIFEDVVVKGRSATEVSKEVGMTLAAVGMVKLRVQRKIREAKDRLDSPKDC